jgi:hypothetical protein
LERNKMQSDIQSPQTQYTGLPPQSRKPFPWLKIFVCCSAGCGLLGLLLILGIVAAFRNAGPLVSNADRTGQQFLQAIQRDEPEKAYSLTSTLWHQSSTLMDFTDLVKIWRQQQGDLESIRLVNSSWYSGTNGSRVNLFYAVHGSRKDSQVTMVVVSEGKGMFVQSCNFNFHSPGAAPSPPTQ